MTTTYEVNDYVRYAANGICRITDIAAFDAKDGHGEAVYYVLRPVGSDKTTLYVPVENPALTARMNRVPTKAQLDDMIRSAGDSELLWMDDRKQRGECFHEILKSCDQRSLLRLVSCLYLKRGELAEAGKRLSASDSVILKQAERLVQSDFAFVLDIKESEVEGYISALLCAKS